MSDLKERLEIMADMISLCEGISWGSDSAIMREAAYRIEELEAKLATAMEALGKIASQPRTDEHADGEGNFEEGYDACVDVARAAIRAMKQNGTKP